MNAVIFDLDGTLWDAMDPIYSAWAAALERSALPHIALTREFLSGCMGKTPEEIGALAFPDAPRAEREAEMQKLYEYENELLCHCGGILYPGLPETLAALAQKYALFVVSNSQDGYVQAFLHWSGLTCFRDIEMVQNEPAQGLFVWMDPSARHETRSYAAAGIEPGKATLAAAEGSISPRVSTSTPRPTVCSGSLRPCRSCPVTRVK